MSLYQLERAKRIEFTHLDDRGAHEQAHVDAVARGIVAKHGFVEHRSYVAQEGRGEQIELFFVVPENDPPRPLVEWDQLRDEIGDALGEASPDRWLTE